MLDIKILHEGQKPISFTKKYFMALTFDSFVETIIKQNMKINYVLNWNK